jgi:AraC-like DNA-binding protein
VLQELIAHGEDMRSLSVVRSRVNLHTMPTSAGYEVRENTNYSWDGRLRGNTPFTVLQHTISGRGSLRYENRDIKIHAGETLLVIIPHNHRYWLEKGDRWEYFWISMNGIDALRIHETVLNAHGPVFKLKSKTIDRLANCTLRLLKGEAETPGAASAIAYEAAMHLHDDVFGPSDRVLKEQNSITRTMEHIAANLGADLSVDVLASVAGLSRAHFSRSFASMTGLPPAEYVQQRRMRRAARLLTANREMSIKEIAALCGMPENNYFSKVFRKAYGISPTEFRTNGMYASADK